ncbi:hypothetical protein [Actinacidiphila yeochonensis]|uniref:hypothetical protein n=1 Tax=Actinacidiphila yeochonensis TaxID=89050 RepID=UPI000B33C618|nr:hypothetical protein [Actinacidiphila yeochonensis]
MELSPRPRLTIRRPLRSYGQFDSFMDSFSFFENLPSHVRHEFLERSISRRFGRGDQLRASTAPVRWFT